MDNKHLLKQTALFADLCRQLNKDADEQQRDPNLENNIAQNAALRQLPRNAATGKEYKSVNAAMLLVATERNNFESSEWATFKQWHANNETIRKGEKGTVILRYTLNGQEDDVRTSEAASVKLYRVFNRAQLKSWQPKE